MYLSIYLFILPLTFDHILLRSWYSCFYSSIFHPTFLVFCMIATKFLTCLKTAICHYFVLKNVTFFFFLNFWDVQVLTLCDNLECCLYLDIFLRVSVAISVSLTLSLQRDRCIEFVSACTIITIIFLFSIYLLFFSVCMSYISHQLLWMQNTRLFFFFSFFDAALDV